jgi:hypothetical protein
MRWNAAQKKFNYQEPDDGQLFTDLFSTKPAEEAAKAKRMQTRGARLA